jgi:hypothetical protein
MRIFSVLHIILLWGHKTKGCVGTDGIVIVYVFLQLLIHLLEVVPVHHKVFVPHNELFL